MGVLVAATELGLKPVSGMEQQERTPRTTLLLVMAAFRGRVSWTTYLLCNHINIMAELIDSQGLVAVDSVYIKQDQLHGNNEFFCIDTE